LIRIEQTLPRLPAHAGLVEINSTDFGFTDPRWSRELLQRAIGDEALIDGTQGMHKSLQNVPGSQEDLGKFLYLASTLELLGIVNNDLDAKHALAFDTNLCELDAIHLSPHKPS
jgi:hypothetical protein